MPLPSDKGPFPLPSHNRLCFYVPLDNTDTKRHSKAVEYEAVVEESSRRTDPQEHLLVVVVSSKCQRAEETCVAHLPLGLL